MPVSGDQLVYVLIALLAVGAVAVVIRKISDRNQLSAGRSAKQVEERRPRALAEPERAPETAGDRAGRSKDTARAEGEAGEDEEQAERESSKKAPAEARIPESPATKDQELEKLSEGLAKTRSSGFVARLGKIFSRKQIDRDLLEELEEVLFTADIGPKTANKLFQAVKTGLSKTELEDPDAVWQKLREESNRILDIDAPPIDYRSHKPFVLLVLGVNGAGKTTTIGKLASKLRADGLRVLLAAGDTFRAAAVEQLEVWAQRSGCEIVRGKEGGDPSSVIFEAIQRGQSEGYDVVIADTAGRLHTKVDLMEELKKVGRVCNKAMSGSPHETWLVLDSTTGQNAIQQAEIFKDAMAISGIVLTKLDGTAKGGVILGICDEMSVPVRFIGIGEKIEDLREFHPETFVDALYGARAEERAA